MKMRPHLPFLTFLFSTLSAFSYTGEKLTVSLAGDSSRHQVELISLNLEDHTATLRMAGQEAATPLGLLSEKSRQLIEKTWNAKLKEINQLNTAIGHPLFSPTGNLWDENAEAIAARLRLPEESKTPYTSSYRRYLREGYEFLGTFPRTMVLYGNEDQKAESLSLMYSNKGDNLSTVGSGEDHFDDNGKKIDRGTLRGAMQYDEKTIAQAITSILGESRRQRMQAEGKSKINTDRWDWKGHSFILAHADDEYVHLRIVKSNFADNRGRKSKEDLRKTRNDGYMRKRLKSNVVNKDNGDVYIDHIPMVDQGPKGYCAPATFERAMRHAEVPADMYLLATIATIGGGGTNTRRLFEEVSNSTRRTGGRTARQFRLKSLEPKRIKKYIDKGVPILWGMKSLQKYNQIANTRTVERREITAWDQYAEKITKEAEENVKQLRLEENHHLCLIIGYNEETGEVAVSDSWGKRYTCRWVHYLEADAVSSGDCYAIDL